MIPKIKHEFEINNMPVKQTFQTSGRYREEVASGVKT